MALNNVAEDIVTLLDDASKGTAATDLFSFQWGSTEDGVEVNKQIMVRHTDDIPNGHKTDYEQPTFNILVRGNTNEGFVSVHDRARDIYEFMVQQVRQTLNGTEYLQYAPIGGLIPIGKDSNNRVVFSMNFFTFRNSIGA